MHHPDVTESFHPRIARASALHVLPLLLGVVLAVIVAGCSEGRLVLPMQHDPHPAAQARPLIGHEHRTLTTHGDALRQTAGIISQIGLPIPDQYTVFVYRSREQFQQGLVRDAQISPGRAAELAGFAIGVGKRRLLLFNDEDGVGRGREWVRLVAHELTHLAQFELAEGEGRGEQWLVEGMAEWTAFTVLERLGLDMVSRRQRIARSGVHDRGVLVSRELDLDTLGTPGGFTRRHVRDGSLPIYQLAFLMADYLIEREGMEHVVSYFRSFQSSRQRHDNFEQAFGQSLEAFEREVSSHLGSVSR